MRQPRRKHGCTYATWFRNYEAMVRRASGKHGARCYQTVTVCPEWLNDPRVFGEWAMASGFAPGLTIDRIDPELGYEPLNCQWVTLAENISRSHVTSPRRKDPISGRFAARL